MRFLGYRVEYYKLFVFVVSAVMAGIAGALYVPQVGIINPSEFAPANSIEIVIWVAIGGRGTLHGAILGAILVNYLKTWFTGAIPELWLFGLGGLFIAVTLFLPKGVIGLLEPLPARTRREAPDVAAGAGADERASRRNDQPRSPAVATPARSGTTPSSISMASRSASTASRRWTI